MKDNKLFSQEMSKLFDIGDQIRESLSDKTRIRDDVLTRSRQLIRLCANTIRAIHRNNLDEITLLLEESTSCAADLRQCAGRNTDLYFAGYTQDALKEFVEVNVLYSIVYRLDIPSHIDLQVEPATYLKGLSEAATELRRTILDIIRTDHLDEAERLLGALDEIYNLLITMDFPDAITAGLRRNTDILRSVRERTRGDLTMSIRHQRLEKVLERIGKLQGKS
ncbi:MAG TPA: haloacid dehalogenase [Chloroflexi bacterium]|nr:haloacid dehalogenase [Chloroflexota bacterium]